ncbi:MAG: formylglycine-generating enzyme family protein [Planctomycetota bacterium]|nr:formylglycine-generating enzyme family protein [Planctomycetota bacterium]
MMMPWNNLQEESVSLGKGIMMDFVLIPSGSFVMGSPIDETGRFDDETQCIVTISKPFYLGRYLVTQEQWEVVMGGNPSLSKGKKNPVENVSWQESKSFLKGLSKLTSKTGYRLPTEAEWEYACRAGTSTPYNCGNVLTSNDANFDERIGKTSKVGQYSPNAFGLYDMHGNVSEWCADLYGEYPLGSVADPSGPRRGKFRVLRGGSFCNHLSVLRSACRNIVGPPYKNAGTGFRVVRSCKPRSAGVNNHSDLYGQPLDFVSGVQLPYREAAGEKFGKCKKVENCYLERQPQADQSRVKDSSELVVRIEPGVTMHFLVIPAGTFWMGSPANEIGRYEDELLHKVTLSKPYYMSKFPVTQAQWLAVMGTNPSYSKGKQKPAENITWEDCQRFILRLRAKTGMQGVRLPTEAEWEYACRAGTMDAYYFGPALRTDDANFLATGIGTTTSVGKYPPNRFGLYDMHGNVWEWCADWFGNYPEGPVTDPTGPRRGKFHLTRGGSFLNRASVVRAADRNVIGPPFRNGATGFRLACDYFPIGIGN